MNSPLEMWSITPTAKASQVALFGRVSMASHIHDETTGKRSRFPQLRTTIPITNGAPPSLVEPASRFCNLLTNFAEKIDPQDSRTSGIKSSELSYQHTSGPRSSLLSTPLNFMGGLSRRAATTLRGSANEIGWLQCAYPMTPVQDGTMRFMELLSMTRNGVHRLPNKLVYFLVPGLFSNHLPLCFIETSNFLSKLGLTCHIANIHSEASVKTNAQELKRQIENIYLDYGKKVLVLGHSKGGLDAAAAMSMYWQDLKNKVAGLALVQSPYGGTPIASDILREGQIADIETRTILELVMHQFIKGDMNALEDLTYSKRREFLSQYTLPKDFPVVSFHTGASADPQALATLSYIAHLEFPSIAGLRSMFSSNQSVKLPIMAPLPTVMAACAAYLELRYGEKSDGMVTRKDGEVPGSVVVRPDRKLDHVRMVNPCSAFDTSEPNAPQMCEALLALLVEIVQGKSKFHKIASL